MKKENWLLVANSSIAHLFKIETIKEFKEIKVMEHPESRLHNIDLVSDKPGTDFESVGTARHALEPKTLPKDQEFNLFAKSIAEHLEQAFNNQEFESLYIAASPSMLGLLRQTLHSNVIKSIKGEVDKDFTQMKSHELPSLLPFWS